VPHEIEKSSVASLADSDDDASPPAPAPPPDALDEPPPVAPDELPPVDDGFELVLPEEPLPLDAGPPLDEAVPEEPAAPPEEDDWPSPVVDPLLDEAQEASSPTTAITPEIEADRRTSTRALAPAIATFMVSPSAG
jgi:hypothetical protein